MHIKAMKPPKTLLWTPVGNHRFSISQMYQKWWGDVLLGNSSGYCTVYKLQDKTEQGLIKTALIYNVSHFSLGV